MMGNGLMSWRLQKFSSYRHRRLRSRKLRKGGYSILRTRQEEQGLEGKDFEASLYLSSHDWIL